MILKIQKIIVANSLTIRNYLDDEALLTGRGG